MQWGRKLEQAVSLINVRKGGAAVNRQLEWEGDGRRGKRKRCIPRT